MGPRGGSQAAPGRGADLRAEGQAQVIDWATNASYTRKSSLDPRVWEKDILVTIYSTRLTLPSGSRPLSAQVCFQRQSRELWHGARH